MIHCEGRLLVGTSIIIPESVQDGLPVRSQSLKRLYKKCNDIIPVNHQTSSGNIECSGSSFCVSHNILQKQERSLWMTGRGTRL